MLFLRQELFKQHFNFSIVVDIRVPHIIQAILPMLSIFAVVSICLVFNMLSRMRLQPHIATLNDICEVLRGTSAADEREAGCKKRICMNVISDAVRGKWRLRKNLKEQEIMHRKKMDAEIRLRMKVPWPASLYRNDSRLVAVQTAIT